MSLLLDALKKAADDKRKAVQTDEKNTGGKEPGETTRAAALNSNDEELSLELDELPGDAPEPTATREQAGASPDNGEAEMEKPAAAQDEAPFTISDEALSMLIHKTNDDVKRSNRTLVFGSLLTGLVIIVTAGIYYYFDTREEIASLERKHRITMQQMRAKTSGDKGPKHSAIIRNLVSDETLDDKVKYAKEHLASKKNAQQTKPAGKKSVQKQKAAKSVLSIEKTHKSDPLDEMLQAAWQAYESGHYGEAGEKYREVLAREAQNRDAMLGLAAIALKKEDLVSARRYYLALLELDPRDPVAAAGLSSMQNDAVSVKEHENYLLAMLQKNPGAAALNFALANVYARQGKWQSAQQYYFNAWQTDADNADYIYNLAVSLDQLGKTRQALRFYRDSLKKAGNRQVGFSREAVSRRIQELSGV